MEKIEFLSIFKKQAIHIEAKSIFLSKLVILANFSTFQNKLRNLKKKIRQNEVFFPPWSFDNFFSHIFFVFEQKLEFCDSVRN